MNDLETYFANLQMSFAIWLIILMYHFISSDFARLISSLCLEEQFLSLMPYTWYATRNNLRIVFGKGKPRQVAKVVARQA